MRIDCLDNGYVELLNVAGQNHKNIEGFFDASDSDIADVAKVSTNKDGVQGILSKDFELTKNLLEWGHGSPFEFIEVWVEMKLPIFVARQFIRHRTASVIEQSARYAEVCKDWYVPDQSLMPKVTRPYELIDALNIACRTGYNQYKEAIEKGLSKEYARLFLSLTHYTRWVWKQDLRNMINMLMVRRDKSAQYEAQVYANAIWDLLKVELPELMKIIEENYNGRL